MSQLHPTPKSPVAPNPGPPAAIILVLGRGDVALPPARGVAGSSGLLSPVVLQRVGAATIRSETITNENLEIFAGVGFVMERQINQEKASAEI